MSCSFFGREELEKQVSCQFPAKELPKDYPKVAQKCGVI
jgi:hypothetical protein